MKEKANELIEAPVFNIKEAEAIYQELARQEGIKRSFKDFVWQYMANARTDKEFAEVKSDLQDIINDVIFEAKEMVETSRQSQMIKRIYG